MNMRRRLQAMLQPQGATGGRDAHGGGGTAARRLMWLALGSVVAMALFSMATLSSTPALRVATTGGVPAPARPDPKAAALATGSEEAKLLAAQRARVESVAESLSRISLQTTAQRGVVLPLFDHVAFLGFSLIMELRAQGVDLPIEVPHCGDLDEKLRDKLQQYDPAVRVYDVCLEASSYSTPGNKKHKLFCRNMNECHRRFRSFDIKILALLLSRFDEVMMLDADTLFFQNPMTVWQTKKYQETGTLFFHDRMSCDHEFLASRRARRGNITHLEEYLSDFDPVPFQNLKIIPRPRATSTAHKEPPISLPFEPSEFLMRSHSWNRRAGHQADSSLMLWDKRRQQRATAILGSFIAFGGISRPPSYGDKEFYFISCELAESAYAFSDFGTGAIGTDVRNSEEKGNSVLCGDALHYVPEDTGSSDPATLYINSDHITSWKTSDKLWRSKARPASLFPGKIELRHLAQECPFDISVERVTEAEIELLARRQKFHEIALSWNATIPVV